MKKIFAVIVLVVVFLNTMNAQDTKFEALFVYNFTRQIDWPTDYKSGTFYIKVLGESEIVSELKNFTKDKKVGGTQDITVESVAVGSIGKCHVLFIPTSKSGELSAALAQIAGNSTLVITEQSNLTSKGAGISFIKDNDVLKYQFNQGNLDKQKLKVGSDLKELGISH